MMGFALWFIQRRVATILLTVALAVLGILGYVQLPVSPLPQIEIPTIIVTASMTGADAETMASSVATPLERALGRISGVSEMTSTSSTGSTSIILQFDLTKNIEEAAQDVQSAINASRSTLPSTLADNPTYRKLNPADRPILVMALTSDIYSLGQLYDIASQDIAQKLLQVQGVADVGISGSSLPAVRVSVNAAALVQQGISLTDVSNAIANANSIRPKGTIQSGTKEWVIEANDSLTTAQDYSNIVVQKTDKAVVYLKDVAEVTDSVENKKTSGNANGEPAIILAITKSNDANIIETVENVAQAIDNIVPKYQGRLALKIMQDRSPTIRSSLSEVKFTLVISVFLVVGVVYLFLGNLKATLIPGITIPITLLGTFAVMYVADFSLNNLSLLALTIATGFIVDDAIVVLENAVKHVEKGMTAKEAAANSIGEVGFTIISMSLSLAAVFVPFLFLGDLLGRLFLEFAATLTIAILLSLIVSLTLTPMMCALWLNSIVAAEKKKSASVLSKGLQVFWRVAQKAYRTVLRWCLRHSFLTFLSIPLTIYLMGYLFTMLQAGFFPQQDTGLIYGTIRGDQSASFYVSKDNLDNYVRLIHADPDVESVLGSTGTSGFRGNTRVVLYITLKPLNERDPMNTVLARLRKLSVEVPGTSFLPQAMQDLPSGTGRAASAAYQYTLQSDDVGLLRKWEGVLRKAMSEEKEFLDIDSDQEDKGMEIYITYDREKMASLGISVAQTNRLLYDHFGQRSVSTIYDESNQYRVILEADEQTVQNENALNEMYLINTEGQPVPLASFAQWTTSNSPQSVQHQDSFASTTIAFNLADGVSLSQATVVLESLIVKIGMPTSVKGSFQGDAKSFRQGQGSQIFILFGAIVGVYLVLGILYESYWQPITILSTLPSAGFGAVFAFWLTETEFSVMGMIAILMLIGLVKKNAIMLVDYAIQAQKTDGIPANKAIYLACQRRLRPILMTTLAAMFGALPLILGEGNGAELRYPLGIGIIGGLFFSQLLTLFTTPVVYLFFERLPQRRIWSWFSWRKFIKK